MSEPTAELPDPPLEPPAPPTAQPARRHQLFPALTAAGFLILAAGLIWVWRHPAVPPYRNRTDRCPGAPAQCVGGPCGPAGAASAAANSGPGSARCPGDRPGATPAAARRSSRGSTRPCPDREAPGRSRAAAAAEPRAAGGAARWTGERQPDNAGRAVPPAGRRRKPPDRERKAAQRIPLVQAATLALAAGQKLGDLPGAPPALARFANAAPPTEAALRLAFPQAAREALAAAHPATEGQPLLARLWAQAQDLVTIRQGDRVLVGDPAAGVLQRARAALDAGDLAAAVAEIGTLQGAPAQAMAAWLVQARSLLEARAALAAWAAAADAPRPARAAGRGGGGGPRLGTGQPSRPDQRRDRRLSASRRPPRW